MSNLKRFLAMSLVVFMMVGALAMTASAASLLTDVDPKDYKEYGDDLVAAIGLLNSLGIVKGTSANATTGEYEFSPDDKVTREQFSMFTARIHTGTPEYFNVRYEAEQDLTVFEDVNGVDPLWYQAINYCYENNIITGKSAPKTEDSKDGIFGLGDSIMFQDAVTMLVRSLGYDKTGLSYPVGFLAKAREIGLLDGFGGTLSKMTAQAEITRAEMAMLLYNYFMADFYEVNLLWNQTSAQFVDRVTYKPVSEKFGITKIEGYVTAIEGAALPMWVEDPYNSEVVGAGGAVTDLNWVLIGQNDPISMRNANPANAGHFNIIVSWVTSDVSAATTSWVEVATGILAQTTVSGSRVVGHLRTTKAALGLDTEYPDLAGSRELLGLKVLAFVDSKNRPNIKLPETRVLGTKTRATKSVVEGDLFSGDERNRILNYFEFDDGVTKHKFNQYNHRFIGSNFQVYENDNLTGNIGQARQDEGDINRYTGYVFMSNESGLAWNVYDSGSTSRAVNQAANDIRYLAGVIKSGNANLGSMDIDIIDNGNNKDGTPNRYVIFTPYEAGYITNHDDGPTGVTGSTLRASEDGYYRITLGDGTFWQFRRNDSVQKFYNATTYASASISQQKAYFFSHQGEHVLIGKQLNEVTHDGISSRPATVAKIDGSSVTFSLDVANTVYAGSYGNIVIDFNNHDNVYYRTLSNRRPTVTGSSYILSGTTRVATPYKVGAWTFTESNTANAYQITQYQKYRIFTIESTQPQAYGFYGGAHNSFLIIRTEDGVRDSAPRYGYVISLSGSYNNVLGENVTTYDVWNLTEGRTETINVVGPRDYDNLLRGTAIRYETVGFYTPNTHRILGAVDLVQNRNYDRRASVFTFNAKAPAFAAINDSTNGITAMPNTTADLAAALVAAGLLNSTNGTNYKGLIDVPQVTGLVKSAYDTFIDAAFNVIDAVKVNCLLSDVGGIAAATLNDFGGGVSAMTTFKQYVDTLVSIPAIDNTLGVALGTLRTTFENKRNDFNTTRTLDNLVDLRSAYNSVINAITSPAMKGAVDSTTWAIIELQVSDANTAWNTLFKAFKLPTARLTAIASAVTPMDAAYTALVNAVGTSPTGETKNALDYAKAILKVLNNFAKSYNVNLESTAVTVSSGVTTPVDTTKAPGGSAYDPLTDTTYSITSGTYGWTEGDNKNGSGILGSNTIFFNSGNMITSQNNTNSTFFGNFLLSQQTSAISVDMPHGIGQYNPHNGFYWDRNTNNISIGTPNTFNTSTAPTTTNTIFNGSGVRSATMTATTQIFIYNVNSMTDVNTLSLSSFRDMMWAILSDAGRRGAIKTAFGVTNAANQVVVLYLGIDPTAMTANSSDRNVVEGMFTKTPHTSTASPQYYGSEGLYVVTSVSNNIFLNGAYYRTGTAVGETGTINIAIPTNGQDSTIAVGDQVRANTEVYNLTTGEKLWVVERVTIATWTIFDNLNASALEYLRTGNGSIYRMFNNATAQTATTRFYNDGINSYATASYGAKSNPGTSINYLHMQYSLTSLSYTRVAAWTGDTNTGFTYSSVPFTGTDAARGTAFLTTINGAFTAASPAAQTTSYYAVPTSTGFAVIRIDIVA